VGWGEAEWGGELSSSQEIDTTKVKGQVIQFQRGRLTREHVHHSTGKPASYGLKRFF
jgi:hypothetical protein